MMIELVFTASDGRQILLQCGVAVGCTVREAIVQSELLSQYPEIDLAQCGVGLFSRRVCPETELSPGDRIEIYQPLRIDPKESRRRRQRLNRKP